MDFAGGAGRPLDELCASIVERYHSSLYRSLPLIHGELARLADTDPAPPPMLAETRAAFAELSHQLQSHLAKEENLLFPALEALARADRAGGPRPLLAFSTVLHPIRVMETEHARIESTLDRLRELTHAFVAPERASERWRHCLAALSQLDADLRAHHREESEVLFPRALEIECRMP